MKYAPVAELAYALRLGRSLARVRGSNPLRSTHQPKTAQSAVFG